VSACTREPRGEQEVVEMVLDTELPDGHHQGADSTKKSHGALYPRRLRRYVCRLPSGRRMKIMLEKTEQPAAPDAYRTERLMVDG
jgi:hypothetical protein